ncbi:acriflavin resistance protein [Tolumonas auensis DSM 9187]|uniref:Acriflavin resistance protein n=1 Tax=Tolumonas auensis (strain DSM 9187 / NBRC 110442 / TA 4) TaxID=595494 RepID=C4L925_TOLAT|nr:efflux RND transporter permease subunit [Tolumonas auensis]ACQ93895.1 acriflavin resistance protein [Tolumonas auensis DSM 9187]
MQLSMLSIRRPVMTCLLMAFFTLFGILAYRALPVSELPQIDFPTINVTASLSGASPETMASAVATPLEGQLATISGIDNISSSSSQGITRITLQFDLDRNIDAAALDVQSALSSAQRKLPQNMTSSPSMRKSNPADAPVFLIALHSDSLPISTVTEYAESKLAQSLSMLPGVAQVSVYGSKPYAVRIQADPDKLTAHNLGLDELATAVADNNVNQPLGDLDGEFRSLSLKSNGQLKNAAAYRKLVVAYRNGAPLYLSSIANVLDSEENTRVASWFIDKPGIILAVQRQAGANTISTVDAVRQALPQFQSILPDSIQMDILYDRSESIRASIHDVQFTLLLSCALVVLVIWLFLRNLSATVIPALAVPLSVLGAVPVMYLLNYSLDNLSLLALTLAVGFVVDDAIVMMENIVRHMEQGMGAMQAARKGAREIGFTILSMTLSLIAVFIPLLFMGGLMGRLLHEFAVTISAAIAVSGLVSLTLTPMLCSRVLRAEQTTATQGRLSQWLERGFSTLTESYSVSLVAVLRHPRWVMFTFFVSMALTVLLYQQLPKDFLPSTDSGQITLTTKAAPDTSFATLSRMQQQVAEIVKADPNVAAFMSSVGSTGPNGSANGGSMTIRLVPREQRLSADQVIAELRQKVNHIPGLSVYLRNPPSIRIGGMSTASEYQFTVQSNDFNELTQWHDRFLTAIRAIPGLRDVTSDQEVVGAGLSVAVDRDKLASYGLTYSQVETALQSAFAARQVSTIYADTDQYAVILEVLPERQQQAADLSRIRVRNNDGVLISLDTVASFKRQPQTLTVNHLGTLPAATISFNMSSGMALGDALKALDQVKEELLPPASVVTSLQGSAAAFASSQSGMMVLLVLALLVVYGVLGMLYESFVHPLTILSGLPSAGLGALLTLWLFQFPVTLYAFVGILLLIGIVKKNAIMMIDFALDRERDGMTPDDAIHQACLVRFRPIMMTSIAALAGALPIALGYGAGAELRQPLGVSIVGGLLLSQIVTLYLTPVIYHYLAPWHAKLNFRS